MGAISQRGSSTGGNGRGGAHTSARRGGRRIGFWIGVAVLLHAEIVLLVGIGLYLYAPRSAELARGLSGGDEGAPVDVSMVDEDAAREIVADFEKQEEARKAEEVRKEEESVHPPGQIVDLPTPREERRPDSAHFVSEHDSTVTRETKKYGHFRTTRAKGTRTARPRPRSRRRPRGTVAWRCGPPISAVSPRRQLDGRATGAHRAARGRLRRDRSGTPRA